MARKQARLFTIYHAMEAQGVFDANVANRDSVNDAGQPTYRGPQEYPKILYHPDGELRVTKEPQEIMTRNGDPFQPARFTAAVTEIIWVEVGTRQQEAAMRAEGWHDHPAKAIGKRDGADKAPPMGADYVIKDLQAASRQTSAERDELAKKVAALEEELASAKAAGAPGSRSGAKHRPLLDPNTGDSAA